VPELPDITVYIDALEARIVGEPLEAVRLASPFLLRSVDPPIKETFGKRVTSLRRLGKRIVIGLEDDLFLVIHLMIAGRLHWKVKGAKVPGKIGLAAFDFSSGTLTFTEASPKKRASLYVLRGEAALAAHDPGGIEVLDSRLKDFAAALTEENHTLKRALTDPRRFAGIGNAYSDETLFHARLSPIARTQSLTPEEIKRLHAAVKATLKDWVKRLRAHYGDKFPEGVTAFRPDMAMHGKYGEPCPACASPVQRIVYASNETNYCARCQNGGQLLADRSLSRLLKGDWPRTLEELEDLRRPHTRT